MATDEAGAHEHGPTPARQCPHEAEVDRHPHQPQRMPDPLGNESGRRPAADQRRQADEPVKELWRAAEVLGLFARSGRRDVLVARVRVAVRLEGARGLTCPDAERTPRPIRVPSTGRRPAPPVLGGRSHRKEVSCRGCCRAHADGARTQPPNPPQSRGPALHGEEFGTPAEDLRPRERHPVRPPGSRAGRPPVGHRSPAARRLCEPAPSDPTECCEQPGADLSAGEVGGPAPVLVVLAGGAEAATDTDRSLAPPTLRLA